MNDQQRAAMQDDPYNGDDGPGFDYEFHAQLLAGAHLMSDEQREFFYIGWKAGRNFEAEKQAQPQGEWVELTDDEIEDAVGWTMTEGAVLDCRAVIAAFKAKNAPPVQREQQEPVVLQDIEQYRMQMAGISTAAIGYWKEGDLIHPDYDTQALRDVAKLYAEYASLNTTPPSVEAAIEATKEKAAKVCERLAGLIPNNGPIHATQIEALADAASAIRSME